MASDQTTKRARKTPAERDARCKAAYDRGWRDSLTAFFAVCEQPWSDKYDYLTGWWACADDRWQRNPMTG